MIDNLIIFKVFPYFDIFDFQMRMKGTVDPLLDDSEDTLKSTRDGAETSIELDTSTDVEMADS